MKSTKVTLKVMKSKAMEHKLRKIVYTKVNGKKEKWMDMGGWNYWKKGTLTKDFLSMDQYMATERFWLKMELQLKVNSKVKQMVK